MHPSEELLDLLRVPSLVDFVRHHFSNISLSLIPHDLQPSDEISLFGELLECPFVGFVDDFDSWVVGEKEIREVEEVGSRAFDGEGRSSESRGWEICGGE